MITRIGNINDRFLCLVAYTLNIADLVCTLIALEHGATELNPLMQNVPIMIIYKVVVIGALVEWLSHRREVVARWGLVICTVVYSALVLWHVCGIYTILKGLEK